MQLHNHTYKNDKMLQQFILQHSIQNVKNILIQVFSGVVNVEVIRSVTDSLKETLPQANIIGSTTSGEIQNGKMYDNTITIAFSLFEKTTIKSKLYSFDETFELKDIKNELFNDNTKALILFSDGLKSNTERFLKELHTIISPNIIIAGGRAGDNSEFKETYIFDTQNFSDNGCVIATLSGDDLIVNNDYLLNWTAIGKEMHVTKCDGNVVYEIDNVPIIEIFRKYLGEETVNNLPASSMPFPLITIKDNVTVARSTVAVIKDTALVFAGDFKEDDIIRFSFANIGDLTDNLNFYFNKLLEYPAQAIYTYSCTARKALLADKLQDELNLLESLAPSTGFFTYGEFFQSKRMTELLNVTTTFLILSESKETYSKELQKVQTIEYDPIKKALTHLVKVTTNELEHVSTHDALTSLYNRSEYVRTIGKKIKSAERYNEKFGLILLDIDFFKLVNDNYGHKTGDKVLQALAEVLRLNIREDDFVARWGGEEFIIIANHVNAKKLQQLTKKLQTQIKTIKIENLHPITVSFGLTLYLEGDTEEDIFKRVDNSLYVAKQTGRDRYVMG